MKAQGGVAHNHMFLFIFIVLESVPATPIITMAFQKGGDLGSTRFAKPEVHAEARVLVKPSHGKIAANDDAYALAA